MQIKSKYDQYVQFMAQLADLQHAASLLQWDQEVNLPTGSGHFRARQLSSLAGIIHERATSPELHDLLNTLAQSDELSFEQKRNVQVNLRDINRKLRYSRSFVERMSNTISHAFAAWSQARSQNDFSIFRPRLSELLDLKREECEIIGYSQHPYDALIEEFEPGMKASTLDALFSNFMPQLEVLLGRIRQAPVPSDSFLYDAYPKTEQWDAGLDVLKWMGYDFNRGRQDVSPHPFTISLSPDDVRITTRLSENNFAEMFWSCIHEGGHALYEQGFNTDFYGLPQAEAASLGIHESQSRLWENQVGRGICFWKYYFPILQQRFPNQLMGMDYREFFAAINRVHPTLIRTGADELTYHIHIYIRYTVEKQLISGDLQVDDLPAYWNELYLNHLGLAVPDFKSGVLQDVHWSHGSFGYFPTYSLGSLYAAQFFHTACKDVPDLKAELEQGNGAPLLQWLRTNIHSKGRLHDSEELCKLACGETLNIRYFMEYANKKYEYIYSLLPQEK